MAMVKVMALMHDVNIGESKIGNTSDDYKKDESTERMKFFNSILENN